MPYILSIAAAETDWGFATLSRPSVSVLPSPAMWASGCLPAYIQSREEEWDLVCLPCLDPAALALLVGEMTSLTLYSLVLPASMFQLQKASEGGGVGGAEQLRQSSENGDLMN